jgi:hypothetical protein
LTLFTPDKPIASASDPEHMKEMNRLVDEQTKAGVLIATGAFLKSAEGARVRRIDGDYTVRDGASPFPDVGWAILQADTKEKAIEAVKKFLAIAGDGTCEVRALIGAPPQ